MAILGTGRIGKSSLAMAVLHHPDIMSKFGDNRCFVSCEAASSSSDVISAVATYLGLTESKNLSKAVLNKHFSMLAVPSVLFSITSKLHGS